MAEEPEGSLILDEWINALRSGKYIQNNENIAMLYKGKYSAFGVLCDVYDPNGWLIPSSGIAAYFYRRTATVFAPPASLLKDLGFSITYLTIPEKLSFDLVVDRLEYNRDNYLL